MGCLGGTSGVRWGGRRHAIYRILSCDGRLRSRTYSRIRGRSAPPGKNCRFTTLLYHIRSPDGRSAVPLEAAWEAGWCCAVSLAVSGRCGYVFISSRAVLEGGGEPGRDADSPSTGRAEQAWVVKTSVAGAPACELYGLNVIVPCCAVPVHRGVVLPIVIVTLFPAGNSLRAGSMETAHQTDEGGTPPGGPQPQVVERHVRGFVPAARGTPRPCRPCRGSARSHTSRVACPGAARHPTCLARPCHPPPDWPSIPHRGQCNT